MYIGPPIIINLAKIYQPLAMTAVFLSFSEVVSVDWFRFDEHRPNSSNTLQLVTCESIRSRIYNTTVYYNGYSAKLILQYIWNGNYVVKIRNKNNVSSAVVIENSSIIFFL